MKRTIEDYLDIIKLPHHVSQKHPQMSLHDRAAQFAPFAALTGHADAVKETARLVCDKMILAEDAITDIVDKLNYIEQNIESKPAVEISYFVQDRLKQGGNYITQNTCICKIDNFTQQIYLENGTKVFLEDICSIILKE